MNVDVDDSQHSQPYSQERLIEGDSVTVAVDIDKAMEWQPNAHTTSFKGHRCYEYTVALRDDGKKDAYRRNAWDFDIKFMPLKNRLSNRKGKKHGIMPL